MIAVLGMSQVVTGFTEIGEDLSLVHGASLGQSNVRHW